jgi:hypothetical protein
MASSNRIIMSVNVIVMMVIGGVLAQRWPVSFPQFRCQAPPGCHRGL